MIETCNETTSTSSNLSIASIATSAPPPAPPTAPPAALETLIFQGFVVCIAIVGLAANGVTFLAMVNSSQISNRKLLVVQLLIDSLTCLLLAITYLLKFPRFIYQNTTINLILCICFADGELVMWTLNNVSTANLVAIAIERYFMIVHSILHRNNFREWMTNAAIATTWIFAFLLAWPACFLTSSIVNGQCAVMANWSSPAVKKFRAAVYFVFIYVVPVSVFGFCYSRIVHVVRHKMATYSASALNSNAERQMVALKHQMSVIKTLMLVVGCYFVFWSPSRWYYFVSTLFGLSPVGNGARYATVFVAFFDVCFSPFLYATTLDSIKVFIRGKFRNSVNPNAVHGGVKTEERNL